MPLSLSRKCVSSAVASPKIAEMRAVVKDIRDTWATSSNAVNPKVTYRTGRKYVHTPC